MNLTTADSLNVSALNATPTALPKTIMASSMTHKVISSIAMSALIVLSVSGNALVIASFYMYKRIRRSVTNCFIVSLAVSDLMVAFLSEPFWLSFEITQWQSLPNGWDMKTFFTFWIVLDIVCAVASIANLMFISIDRYFAIKSPLSHHIKMTPNASKWIILGVWAYSVGTACLFLLDWEWKFLMIFMIGFLVPLILMVFCYAGILVVVTSKARLSNRVGRRLDKEFKTAKSLGVVTGSFVICWLPFFIVSLVHKYCQACRVEIDRVPAATSAVKWLHYLNSCLNPIIYAFLNPTFKVAFRNLFHKFCSGHQQLDDNSFSLSFRPPAKRRGTKTSSLRRSSNKENHQNGKVPNGNLLGNRSKTKKRKLLRFKTPLEESFKDSSSTDKGNEKTIVDPHADSPNMDDISALTPCLPREKKEIVTVSSNKSPDSPQIVMDNKPQHRSVSPSIKDSVDTETTPLHTDDGDSILSDSNNNPGESTPGTLLPRTDYRGYTSLDNLISSTGKKSPIMLYDAEGSLDLFSDRPLSNTTDSTEIKSLGSPVFDEQFSTYLDQENNQFYLFVDGELIPEGDIRTSNV